MQFTKILAVLFVTTTAFTCSKNDETMGEEDFITLSYMQTQCADPWPTSADDNVTAQNVKKYLDSAGVEVTSVAIKKTSDAAACAACVCPSGKTIYVTTPNNNNMKAKVMELKFN